MANITPRVLAISTAAVVAGMATVSGALAVFSPVALDGHTCTGYGQHAEGYGYDCTPNATPENNTGATLPGGGAGGSSGSTGGSSGGTVYAGGGSTPSITPTPTPTPTSNETTKEGEVETMPNPVTNVIFKSFTKKCEVAVKDLTDSRLTPYYGELNVINRSNLGRALTRAEFLKLVLNAAKVDVSGEATPNYTDVDASHTLKNYIAYATRIGMVSGHNGAFRPNDTITRAEAAKIFVNAAGLNLSVNVKTFSDVSTSNTLKNHIQTAYDNCILHGRKTMGGDTTLANEVRVYEPNSGITLAETAKVLYNIAH